MQGPLCCPHPAQGLEGLADELPPGFGPEFMPRVLQMTSALHLPFFLMGILCIYSFVFCNLLPTLPGQRRSLPVPRWCRKACSPGEPRTHTDPRTGTSIRVSPCQIWMQKASGSSRLRCVCSCWLVQKSFTRKPGCL